MDNNVWSIDKIENNIALLENINTQEKKEVILYLLPKNIKEGTLVSYKNNKFIQEPSLEEKRRQEILKRFENLRKNI